jgi:hypothetical protein
MKRLTIILISFALLCTVAFASASDQQTPFEQANTEFAQQDFRRAAAHYQAIITRDGFSAPVLFNLANAYYRDGKIGLAILNYERARVLAPTDADIAFNIHVARAKAGLADRPTTWTDNAAHFFNLNTFSWLGSGALLVIAVGLMTRQSMRRHRFAWRTGMLVSSCVLLATICAVCIQWPQLQDGIVTVKNTPVYISPVTVSQPLYTLAEGQTVALEEAHGEFSLVQTSDGHRGWVKTADVGRLIPSESHPRATSNQQA